MNAPIEVESPELRVESSNSATEPQAPRVRIVAEDFFAARPYAPFSAAKAYWWAWRQAVRTRAPLRLRKTLREYMREDALLAVKLARLEAKYEARPVELTHLQGFSVA